MNRSRYLVAALVAIAVLASTGTRVRSQEAPFEWNKAIPEKKPGVGQPNNGKLVLFDASHGCHEGNADWVIDGGFSRFADELVERGYTVREYRGVDLDGDGIVRFSDDRTGGPNEAVIVLDAIDEADVFVMAETNRPLRVDEYEALKAFVDSGKGIYFIADHYNADRNLNSWDSTEVFNGYNRSDRPEFQMAAPYGDYRNPKEADAGWLAENFGVRFRFNSVDFKAGATGIVPPAQAENLTAGVDKVIIAAGATLAVVDPARAKGIVYLDDDDAAKSWQNAVEGPTKGLYFGGDEEGPLVAISKPSAGKAAFIGDSSPIEDITPKYRRQDNGKKKSLHEGWDGAAGGDEISLAIVDWLAEPESYVGFSGADHPPGVATPDPMAPIETIDPDNGKPWREPEGGYDPWDPETFAFGSFGAKFGPGAGGGVIQPPAGEKLTVAQAFAEPNGSSVTVVGVIQAAHNGQFGLQLSDAGVPGTFLAVKLSPAMREEFNPLKNPAAAGKKAVVVGKRGKYTGLPGITGVTSIQFAD